MPFTPPNLEKPTTAPEAMPQIPESETYVEGEPIPEAELARMQEAREKKEMAPAPATPAKPAPAPLPIAKDEVQMKIEKILEENLEEAFAEMTPIEQAAFGVHGDQVAVTVRTLLTEANIKVKMIFETILNWLRMLPGVNFFFIEQEAKIKTDKLLALRE